MSPGQGRPQTGHYHSIYSLSSRRRAHLHPTPGSPARRYAVRFDEGLDNVVVIDGVPVIDESRKDKLFETIKKRFKAQTGLDVDVEGFHLPFGEDGKSKG